ncbi:tautomerase family protein [Pseudomonas cichorii]|uniref:tautomerase family protein n=1 Tax=Pseudomonas cichorii TaxID=36746 RepID=UPI001C88E91F|nr:tautomerase family protein [Pseudomonas cichorii]
MNEQAGGLVNEHKRQLIEGVTELLQKVLNKPPSSTFVVIIGHHALYLPTKGSDSATVSIALDFPRTRVASSTAAAGA